MSSDICAWCQKKKPTLQCGLCHVDLCKYCAQILDAEAFAYLAEKPEKLRHSVYCDGCYNKYVAEAFQNYQEIMEKARNVNVYLDNQGKETRLIRRIEKPLQIENCPDREIALMKLAFLAAEKGYETLVDVSVTYKKVGEGSYKKHNWQARGVPVKS